MTREEAREAAKSMLPAYLESKGIDLRRPFRCLSPSHADRHPSMSYRPRTNTVQCFGCGEHGDIFDVIRMEYGLDKEDYQRIFAKTYQVLGIDVEERGSSPIVKASANRLLVKDGWSAEGETDYTAFFNEASAHIGETDYARRRGLSEAVIHRFRLGFVRDWKNPAIEEARRKRISPSPRLIIPTSPCSYVARDTRRRLSPKQMQYAKLKVGHVRIFNMEVLGQGKRPVFVTEGEIDALSIETVGGHACALGSTAMIGTFLREVEKHCPCPPLIIALDRDAAGMRAKDKLAKGLEKLGITYICANISGRYKDANEALAANREDFTMAVHYAEEVAMETEENCTEKENLVEDMNQTLRDMKRERMGLAEFWEKAIDVIQKTLLSMQRASTALNIIRTWAAGLERAAKEFGMEKNQAVRQIRTETEDLLLDRGREEKWDEIFDLISRLDHESAKLLQTIREEQHENALLSVPAIREAIPLDRAKRLTAPEKLYYSAVKSVVLRDDTITDKAADAQAAKLLIRHKVSDAVICQGLMASPRLKGKGGAGRKEAIMNWLGNLRKHPVAER